ncbi:MAG: VOC family protein [Chloroflexota bacterium]
MFRDTKAFSGFSVNDLAKAKAFYADSLGLDVRDEGENMGFSLHIAGGIPIFVYPKGEAHTPASFTILNFPVPNITEAVDELTRRGVQFEHYDDEYMKTDAKGIAWSDGNGPNIAWFKDPAGNFLAVLEGE